jgi:hypothetical protein
VYYQPQPPYLLLIAGLLISLTSGIALANLIKQIVKDWSVNKSTSNVARMRKPLPIPYIGIALGACIFLSSCLEVFSFSKKFAYGFSFPLTAGTALLVWFQLSNILDKMERGGLQQQDLESLQLRGNIPQKSNSKSQGDS